MEPNQQPAARACSIGAGPMGRALLAACRDAGIAPRGAWARTEQSRRAAADALGLDLPSSLDALVRASDIVFVAVPDHALEQVLDQLATLDGNPLVVLVSGSARIGQLAAGRPTLRLARMHPLRAITATTADVPLAGCIAAITAATPQLEADATHLARRLGMRPVGLADEDAVAWHAAAVLAAGSMVALLDAATTLAATTGVAYDALRVGLADLAIGALTQAAWTGTGAAMTGPVPRVEVDVLRAHREVVEHRLPQFTAAWDGLVAQAIEATVDAGRIDARSARELGEALEPEVVR